MVFRIRFEFHIYLHRDGKKDQVDKNQEAIMPADFCQQAEQEAERLRSQMSRSTIDNYLMAIRSFRSFISATGSDCSLDEGLLKQYERWLHERTLKPNTASCYMRSLRSLITKLYGEDARHLFCQVYTGRAATEKRSLPIDDLPRLKAVRLSPGSFLALVRDLFLFSFYALGMPFVDMAFLRRQQISNGQITYYRHKTGQQVTVRIEPCMQEIIDRYTVGEGDYVFPLLKSTEPEKAYDEYLLMLNRYNRSLKQLADRAGISQRLTSYVARHTWASAAYSNNVDLPVISKALGHANPNNTLVYVRQINDSRVEDANHSLLQFVRHLSK